MAIETLFIGSLFANSKRFQIQKSMKGIDMDIRHVGLF